MRVTAYLKWLSRLRRIGQYQFWNEAKNQVSILGYTTRDLRNLSHEILSPQDLHQTTLRNDRI